MFSVARTSFLALRRDRAAFVLSFVLPIAFFSIFAAIFGGQHDTTPRVHAIVVDEDQSQASRDLVRGLTREGSLVVATHPEPAGKNAPTPPDYTATTAEAAVKAGDAPVALIIPKGFGTNPVGFDPASKATPIELLNDQSDAIAPQVVMGMLQKVAFTSMPAVMAQEGMKYTERYLGEFTPQQRVQMQSALDDIKKLQSRDESAPTGSGQGSGFGAGVIAVDMRSVVGDNKKNSLISFYAAAIGVMFLLFTASGSAGALLDEAESGTLDRVLSSRVTMTRLLAGKLFYNTVLAFVQLVAMFLWGWAVFKLDFFSHLAGFTVMGIVTAFAVAAFGLFLASACHTRAQLGALSTLLILVMSAIGGSMFPRFLMPEAMQKAGLLTLNAWAIDGFTKVFWRNLPISALGPQVGVLLAAGIVLFLVARRVARRWEFA
ncbi:MAG TPA: ABC transporter permease [Terracidiphilus sp.]|nr:ABC transporter permease [Terracidiphilus sp.]